MIIIFPLDLNHTHNKIHEPMNFDTREVHLACPNHMMHLNTQEKCEDLLKTFFFLPFYSRRHIVKSNTPWGQVLPWFCAEVPIYPKDSVHFKHTSTVACAGQKILYKAVLQMNAVLVVFLGCLRSLFPRPC